VSDQCELPLINASRDEVRNLLQAARTIAIVGLSDQPNRPSYGVARYLQQNGYRIIPINPNIQEVLGEKAYPELQAAPRPIDIVDIFRRPDAVPEIVADAIAIGAKAVWMQEGIVHNAAAEQAQAAGLTVVMNKCLMKEHHAAGLARS
jgi:predicted CoA-binding protein